MRKLTIIIFLMILTGGVSAQESFNFEVEVFKNGTAKMTELDITEDEPEPYHGAEGEYVLKAIDSEDNPVWSQNRSINFVIFSNPPTQIESKTQGYSIPYSKEITNLELEKNGEDLISVDLGGLLCNYDGSCPNYCSEKGLDVDCTCGNDVCEDFENQELCPEDCGDNQDVDEQNRGNEQRNGDQEPGGDAKGVDFRYIYVLIGLLTLGLVWIIFRSEF